MPLIKPINPVPGLAHEIGGTDLAIPFRAFGNIGLCFGDTFGRNNGQLIPCVGGNDWRSPVILWTNHIGNTTAPILINGSVKGGDQLWAYPHNNPTFSTVLPCDAMEINGRLYVWVMVTKGLGNERWCELAYSDDRGNTYRNNGQWNTGRFRGMRTMLTFDWVPGSPVIDMFSTGGLARNKGMLRWRCNVNEFLDQSKWLGWCFLDGRWQWVQNPADWQPSEILPGWHFGEICLRFMQGHCLLSGFDAGDYSIFVKVANNTDANWVTAPTYRPVTGIPRGVDWLPQLYGGYIHPDSSFGGGITIIVSNWNTSTGNPYQASQYVIWGILPTVRTGDAAVDGLQATEATKAMLMDEHKPKRQVKCKAMAAPGQLRLKMLVEPETVEVAASASAPAPVISYSIKKLEVSRSLSWSRLYAQLSSMHGSSGAWVLQLALDASPSSMDDEDLARSDLIPQHLRWVDVTAADEALWQATHTGREKVLLRLATQAAVQERERLRKAKDAEDEAALNASPADVAGAPFVPRRPVVDSSMFAHQTEQDASASSSSSAAGAFTYVSEEEDDEWEVLVESGAELVVKKAHESHLVKLAGASPEALAAITRGAGQQAAAAAAVAQPATASASAASSSSSSVADLTSRLAALESLLAAKMQ